MIVVVLLIVYVGLMIVCNIPTLVYTDTTDLSRLIEGRKDKLKLWIQRVLIQHPKESTTSTNIRE